jgi:predicted transcriptional regulator
LQAFGKSLKDRGLFEEYESLSDFQMKLTRQLAQKTIAQFPNEILSADTGPVPIAVVPIAVPERRPVPALGPNASKLLIEANKDRQGVVMNFMTMEGVSIETNGTNFADRGNSRSEALWRGAVRKLAGNGLIEDRGGKGEVYFVTDEGYRVAERLQQQ